ncbi:MAG: hypothetical protein WD225_04375 [Ilumatobacteraceae bacterium]
MSDPLTRLVELTVYAPIGAAMVARERLPELMTDLAAEGRQRVEQRLTVARFLGQMVVSQGRREIERRLAVTDEPPHGPTTARPTPEPGETTEATETTQASAAAGADAVRPTADGLPIDDYESLAASQVVARLRTLDPSELAAIEAFERAHRNRRTVLNRIAQLRTTP